MREEVLALLKEVRPDIDFENQQGFLSGNLLDSFDIITIAAKITEKYGVTLDVSNLNVDSFDTVDSIMELIKKLQG